MTVIIMSFFVGGFLLFSYLIGRAILYAFGYRKDKNTVPINSNPYISAHEFKLKNDSNYEAYLKWMQDKRIHDAPLDKEKIGNESEVDDSINELLKK